MAGPHSDSAADWHKLVDAVVEAATDRLLEQQTFVPFAASIDHEGHIAHNASTNGTEYPATSNLMELLTESIVASLASEEIVIGAIVFDAVVDRPVVPEATEAIIVESHAVSGPAACVAIPYRVQSDRLVVGDPVPID